MTIKALTGLVPEWFTPDSETDDETPASFELRPLTSPEIAKLQNEFDRETGAVSGKGLYDAALLGVVNWRNVTNHEGEALAFNKTNLSKLPYMVLVELGGQSLANSFITGDDEKNL